MPTSSIFANVHINDPQKAEAFINAMYEANYVNPVKREASVETHYLVDDPEKIREIMAKRKKK